MPDFFPIDAKDVSSEWKKIAYRGIKSERMIERRVQEHAQE